MLRLRVTAAALAIVAVSLSPALAAKQPPPDLLDAERRKAALALSQHDCEELKFVAFQLSLQEEPPTSETGKAGYLGLKAALQARAKALGCNLQPTDAEVFRFHRRVLGER